MNTQLGSTMMVVSGCFAPTSTAPVAGRSLAGQASIRASPRYKVSPMVDMFLMAILHKGWSGIDLETYPLVIRKRPKTDHNLSMMFTRLVKIAFFYGKETKITFFFVYLRSNMTCVELFIQLVK